MLKNIISILSLLILTSCSVFTKNNTDQSNAATGFPTMAPDRSAHVTVTPFAEGQVVVSELGQVPIEINQKVLNWVDYFQTRGRDHMQRYLSRSTHHMDLMKEILREEGVPEDLVYIALIESGFNPKAHSRASAVGYWQFIRGTGKRYGLRINGYVDERRDVEMATRAAANYFKSLYNLFGNWYLAMASYNAGENRLKRVVMKYHTRDFWKLAREKRIPSETANYVPKYLAASMIAKNPEKYGFLNINYAPKVEFDKIYLIHGVSLKKLARKIGTTGRELRRLNPALKSYYVPAYRGGNTSLKVPKGTSQEALNALAYAKVKAPKNVASASTFKYRVRRGDNLSVIAKKFRTTVSRLKRLNNLRRSNLRIGQRLRVPEQYRNADYGKYRGGGRKSIATKNGIKIHRVKRGESLWLIARKYKMSLSQLMKLNRLSRRSVIRVGMRLKVKDKKNKMHKVQRGETLLHIAHRYKIRLSKLARANSIKSRTRIKAGHYLVIPR